MGRISALFDPAGYFRCEDPGADYRWTGADILESFNHAGTSLLWQDCFNPPGSEWILPKPRQWSPTWYQDADFDKANLSKNRWVWASGIVPLDYNISDKPGASLYPANKWFAVPRIPAGVASLDARNYDNLFAAAGQAKPPGIATIALAGTTPLGDAFGDAHPFLQFLHPPNPDDTIVFGWWDLCLILNHDVITLMRSPGGDGQAWFFLGSWSTVQRGRDYFSAAANDRAPSSALIGANFFRAEQRLVTCMPVGPAELWLFFSRGDRAVVNLAPPRGDKRPFFPNAPWWIAGYPGQKLLGQIQTVCYPAIGLTMLDTPSDRFLFALGAVYKPTVEPLFNVPDENFLLNVASGGGTGDLVKFWTQNEVIFSSAFSGQQLAVRLKDETNALWASDGTHSAGGVTINFTPGHGGSHFGYTTPMLRQVELKFPPSLLPRARTPLTLNDHEIAGVKVECSLREPLGKRFTLTVWDNGAQKIINAGLDGRGEYPLEIWEDVNGDGTPDTLRIAGWIFEPDLEVLVTEGQPLPGGGTRANPLQQYKLTGVGVLQQANEKWLYLPQFVNPTLKKGTVEHTYAVTEAVLLAGIDVSDGTKYFLGDDPFTGTLRSAIKSPDAEAVETGTGTNASGAGCPDWDEAKVRYAERIARDFAGWSFYERTDGRVLYHADLALDLLMTLSPIGSGVKYVRSGTIYNGRAAAAAAGVPQQVAVQSMDRGMQEPKANVIRISGTAAAGTPLPHFIDRDLASLTDPTYENFVGAPKVEGWEAKDAIDPDTASILTRVGLLRLVQRKFNWSEAVPLAPWEMGSGEVLGYVWQFTNRGDYLIVHTETELVKADGGAGRGNRWVTRLTGERVPSGSTRSVVLGSYPGQGA